MRKSLPKTVILLSLAALLWALGLSSIAAPAPQDSVKPGRQNPTKVEQVIVAFKTHFDIGYTDMASNVVQRYRTSMIDSALEVCDQNRDLPPEQQFVWTIPGWPMSKIAEDWPGQSDDRKRRIMEAFKDGRFVVHALPFTTHTELLEPEDLARGLGFASRMSQAAGRSLPRDAKMTDVPCHSWILPTLLRRAGVDFLHLGCNAASSSPQVPTLFWWQGPDGSRLLTMYTAESYGTGLVPPKNWPHKTWLALIHTGDNHGPPTPAEVKSLLDDAKKKLPDVKVRIGRLSDFADAILAEKPDLPVIRADMPDTWIHGPMCDPAGAKIARNIRPTIACAESLNTLLRTWGVQLPDAGPAVAEAYEQSLLYGEHTWGGALYWVTSYSADKRYNYGELWKNDLANDRFKRLEDSWAEHTAYIQNAERLIKPLLSKQLQALAEAVNQDGERIVVYNPLPRTRSGVVSVASKRTDFNALRQIDNGQLLPVDLSDRLIRFVAIDVPPMGYCTYVPADVNLDMSNLSFDPEKSELNNAFFKVSLDPKRGTVRSLIDTRAKRELVDLSAPHGLGQYLYERFDAEDVAGFVKAYVKISAAWATNELGKPNMPAPNQEPYHAASPKDFTLRLEQSHVAVTAIMRALPSRDVPHAVTTKVILYRDLPCLDVEVTLHNKAADPWPEAGWICLPFKASNPQFRLARLGGIIDPVSDIVPGANRHLLGLNGGAAILDAAGYGAGFCAIDNPLISLGQPGCWKYSMDFTPKKPVAYVNLFNNQWTTNFRLWNSGSWTSRVRIWAIDNYNPASALITPAHEARLSLQAAWADGPGGKLQVAQRGLELSRKGALVTAFGQNPDGPGIILRLWEQAGQSGHLQVRLPAGLNVKTVQPVDLRGQPQGDPVPVKNNAFGFDLEKNAPASFLISN